MGLGVDGMPHARQRWHKRKISDILCLIFVAFGPIGSKLGGYLLDDDDKN
jgi:hypothetical protein